MTNQIPKFTDLRQKFAFLNIPLVFQIVRNIISTCGSFTVMNTLLPVPLLLSAINMNSKKMESVRRNTGEHES